MSAVNRRVVREAVVQTVFECDFRNLEMVAWQECFIKNVAEHQQDKIDLQFGEKLLDLVIGNFADIQRMIVEFAPDWPLEKIARLDRAILQVGMTELHYCSGVPLAVTLNEFVEISKDYGGDTCRRFINGVMSTAKKKLDKQENDDFDG